MSHGSPVDLELQVRGHRGQWRVGEGQTGEGQAPGGTYRGQGLSTTVLSRKVRSKL